MKKMINQLIQLQDLTIARQQHEITSSQPRVKQLDQAIAGMMKELPNDVRILFTRLQKKDHLAIIPVSNQACSACGMTIPVSMIQIIKTAVKICSCPTCARILYVPSSTPVQGTYTKQKNKPQAGIERFSSAGLMLPGLTAKEQTDVIEALAGKLQEEGFVENAQEVCEAVYSREAIASTAMDNGLAFPHVRGLEGGALTLAAATIPEGVRFSNDTRALTRIVFLVVIPTSASAFYLKLLSGLTTTFQKEANREKLLKCKTTAAMWKYLIQVTKKTVS